MTLELLGYVLIGKVLLMNFLGAMTFSWKGRLWYCMDGDKSG
jgi:hypothetical protein